MSAWGDSWGASAGGLTAAEVWAYANRTITGVTIGNGATAPAVIIPGAPADLSMCRLYGYFETVGNLPAASLSISITLIGGFPLRSNKVLAGASITVTTDSDGRLSDGTNPWVDLQRNDLLGPLTGTKYRVICDAAGINSVVTLNAASADLLALVFGA